MGILYAWQEINTTKKEVLVYPLQHFYNGVLQI